MNEERDWARYYELLAIRDKRLFTSEEQLEHHRLWWKLVSWEGLAFAAR